MNTSFDAGFQLGASVEHDAAVAAVAGALLDILGKDAGDGTINLGAAGRWQRYSGKWELVQCAHAYLDEGDTCNVCGRVVAWKYDYRETISGASK